MVTGERHLSGSFQPIDGDALEAPCTLPIAGRAGERSLQQEFPEAYEEILDILSRCRHAFRDELRVEFAVATKGVLVTNAFRPNFETRATISLSVSLAEEGIISREEALLRVDPKSLAELLHAKVDPGDKTAQVLSGVPASPGGATGRVRSRSVQQTRHERSGRVDKDRGGTGA